MNELQADPLLCASGPSLMGRDNFLNPHLDIRWAKDHFRVTAFRGRPEQPLRDLVLRVDAALRQGIRAVKPSGIAQTTHVHKRDANARY
ncbi:MAG: hypothetical protein M3N82_00710 [Pseudomonadota bacterium]|nr:hypothetical protein [Pseudomonadota bacterium]